MLKTMEQVVDLLDPEANRITTMGPEDAAAVDAIGGSHPARPQRFLPGGPR